MLGQFVVPYIDDILFCSPSLEGHIEHVRRVLAQPFQNQLYIKWDKSEFHSTTVSFRGYIIKQDSINMDPAKVTAVTD